MKDDHVPDRVEKGVRFGCGAVVGVIFGIGAVLSYAQSGGSTLMLLAVLVGVVCGALAVRFGDRFWHALRHARWLWLW